MQEDQEFKTSPSHPRHCLKQPALAHGCDPRAWESRGEDWLVVGLRLELEWGLVNPSQPVLKVLGTFGVTFKVSSSSKLCFLDKEDLSEAFASGLVGLAKTSQVNELPHLNFFIISITHLDDSTCATEHVWRQVLRLEGKVLNPPSLLTSSFTAYFLRQSLYSPPWPGTYYTVHTDLKLLILLYPSSQGWH